MPTFRILSAVALGLALSACTSERNEDTNSEPTLSVAAQPLVIVAGNNEFAIDLYKEMAKSEERSFVLSPYSVMNALGMAYLGAAGETKQQMAEVMHLPDPDVVQTKVLDPSDDVEIHSANRVWLDRSAEIKADYLANCNSAFRADPEQVDFSGNPDGAARLVNDWVEAQTQGKIRDLIEPNPHHVLVLTNAVYLKGKWLFPFMAPLTKLEPFYLASGEETKVPLMQMGVPIDYYENESVQVSELPYEGEEFAFTVVLPKERDGLSGVEEVLTIKRVNDWIDGLEGTQVIVQLAKYKTQVKYELSEQLSPMGMPLAFSTDADFVQMSDNKPLFIGAVPHEAFLEVDESGTEAAAATATEMVKSEARPEPGPQPPVFRTDHPFLYMVRHRESGAILFIGRFAGPENGTPEAEN